MNRKTKLWVQRTLCALLFLVGSASSELVAQAAAPTVAPAVPMTAGVRTLYLVRHGAYDIDDPRDEAVGRGLLPLGVAQARVTGDRLRGLPFAFDAVSASPLTRARETAEVIAAQLGGAGSDRSDRSARSAAPRIAIDPDLAECTPPTRRADIMAEEKPEDLAACSAQLERLAPRLLAPLPGGSPARRELVVAHGNVIRWLVTRALGVDTTAWLSMSIGHASVTTIAIDGKGAVRILAVGDVGHLPPGLQTGAFGNRDKWDLEAAKVSEAAEAAAAATAASGAARPIVLMISFDGFRWDYPELHGAPALLALAREGVRAESLVPSFPSKTYPNHYTLVTGLRPEHHGIVANTMWDPQWQAAFSLADRAAVEDGRWWEGEPIWAGAERHGLVTASSFWPGSEAAIGGLRPTYWQRYDATVADEKRVDEVLAWLDMPAARRPRLITLYFAEPDGGGHAFGPASPEAAAAVAHVDAMLARLRAGVATRGLEGEVDWIVVSDHGMTDVAPDKTIVLADYVDPSRIAIDDLSTFGLLRPRAGEEASVLRELTGVHPHLRAARKGAMPERLHYRAHRRIPEIVVWADAGWTICGTRAERAAAVAKADFPRGAHGYDPAERDMHGIFVAAGPSFKKGITTPPLDNVDVYPLLARLIGISPAPNDGNPAMTAAMLAEHMP